MLNDGEGGKTKTQIVIKGVDLQAQLAGMASGKGEFVQTDIYGNMLALINTHAVYSAQNNTCTLTTTTMGCDTTEEVRNKVEGKNRLKKDYNVTFNSGGMEQSVTIEGGKKKQKVDLFGGTMCKKYKDTVTNTQTIKM